MSSGASRPEHAECVHARREEETVKSLVSEIDWTQVPKATLRRCYELTQTGHPRAEATRLLKREGHPPPPNHDSWADNFYAIKSAAQWYDDRLNHHRASEAARKQIRRIEEAAENGGTERFEELRELHAVVRKHVEHGCLLEEFSPVGES